jgi:tetratricopeptide (TPR) repeat protein
MIILDVIPNDLKRELLDGVVHFLVGQAEKMGSDQIAKSIGNLSSQAAFQKAFDTSMERAIARFHTDYLVQDEDLVIAITTDGDFWKSKAVRQGLIALIKRPGAWLADEKEAVVQHFADVLPSRVNRERVDKAVNFFLRCVVEELWTLPGAKEIREVYSLQFQKIGAETARQQVALMEAQLQSTTQLSNDIRQALLQLTTMFEQHLLSAPTLPALLPSVRPYHNLPQPDYTRFVGRQKELDWLRQHLLLSDRTWQIVLTGIGGIGKSTLALAIAHEYREHYKDLQPEERFEAIIWVSAKEEVLTLTGREQLALSGLTFRTLEDIYTTIAQTLEREDITRALLLEEQDRLVQKALSAQRTLLIVDNLENVSDERVRAFLYHLPLPTKSIITSREWIDVAAVLRLTGLPLEEAEKMLSEEAKARGVDMNVSQQEQLFQRTSGLPLPMKLSVARLASGETFEQVGRWLGNATGDLPAYCVRGQIERAHQLDPNAWKLLVACSLFDQDAGASREALGYIADLSLTDRDAGLSLLQRLSLLNHAKAERFWMLPLVQEYTGAALVGANERAQLTERWLSWLLDYVQNADTILAELETEKAQKVRSEYPNLLKAIRWCREHRRWEILSQLVARVWAFPYLSGLFGELQEILEAGIQASKVLPDDRHEGQFLRQFGRFLWIQGHHEKALEYLDKAEAIAQRYTDDLELGRIGNVRSDILAKQGYLLEAEQVAASMLERAERLNNMELKIQAAYRLAGFESQKQHADKALEWLDRGKQWCEEANSSEGLAWNLYLRGVVLMQQGDPTAAEPFLIESLNLVSIWHGDYLMANDTYRLAQVYSETGQLQLALQMAEEAYDLYDRLGVATRLPLVETLLQKLRRKDVNGSA